MLHQRGYAKMFMIFKEDELIGVISFNRIEPLNKTAEIGYWLDESHQGDSKRGTDCSGLVYQVYRKVYRTQVPRNTEDLKKESNKVAKRNLREGDLVFFTSSRSKKKVAHVGIYLKNGKFIHSSTSKGVIVSNLNESYYTKHWISGGRIR